MVITFNSLFTIHIYIHTHTHAYYIYIHIHTHTITFYFLINTSSDFLKGSRSYPLSNMVPDYDK